MRFTKKGLSRRQVLATSLTLPALGSLPGFARAAGLVTLSQFHDLCGTLTGKSGLNLEISNRILTALTVLDSSFPQKVGSLISAMKTYGLKDMSDFKQFAEQNANQAPVAMSIISAWYLGYTGTPAMDATPAVGHPVDDATFVTYVGALMYAPTADTTVIPSYSRGHTNYWVNPPASQSAG